MVTEIILLGDDPAVIPFVEAFVAAGGQVTLLISQNDELSQAVLKVSPSARRDSDWRSTLELAAEIPVLLCGHQPTAHEALRQFIAESRSVWLWPAAADGLELIYELSLVLDDAQGHVLPIWPALEHPVIRQLVRNLRAGEYGQVLTVQLERHCDVPAGQFDIEQVEELFFQDSVLLNRIGGGYNRVTALQLAAGDGQIIQATRTLGADGRGDAVWHLQSAVDRPHWRLRVHTGVGQIILSGEDSDSWNCAVETVGDVQWNAEPHEGSDWSAAVQRLTGELQRERRLDGWGELTRTHEFADAARRSVRRRRTIDLHFETASELSQFKTQMTAIGCGVLMFTLMGLVLYLMLGELLDLSPGFLRLLRILWIAPLVIFLGLQLLVFIARPSSRQRQTVLGEDAPE